MEWIIVAGYTLSLLVVCVFSFEQLFLSILYQKSARRPALPRSLTAYPQVTVQLPVYNERYVIERLIDRVCQLQYPSDRLQIQVLDDSTDDTQELIRAKVAEWRSRGVNIEQVIRPHREGYKAGALQHGLQLASGEFMAIFDADFLPETDFLLRTLAEFDDPGVGMVQTRWGHLNEDYSLLTQAQAFGLNAHFTVEQTGRNATGKFMNFNGTAGVWRKSCIEDADGWQDDTLTEDLDLSYRAQLRGWKFRYLQDVLSPAELPVLVSAIKSQQYRWNKGAAETARKNLHKVWRAKLPWSIKLHAFLHLLNSSVFIFLLVAAVLSIPLLYIQGFRAEFQLLFRLGGIFILGFVAMLIFYWVATRAAHPDTSVSSYLIRFPLFITLTMGMALHNALAVAEGYLGIKTPFVRTPKFNIRTKSDTWKNSSYLIQKIHPRTLIEGLLALYFAFGMASAFWVGDYGLLPFHVMLTVGFGLVFVLSLRPLTYVKTA